MEYQIIPINTIKRIESWLTDEAGFSRSMLHNELDYIFLARSFQQKYKTCTYP